jgi:hypothetical protein
VQPSLQKTAAWETNDMESEKSERNTLLPLEVFVTGKSYSPTDGGLEKPGYAAQKSFEWKD